MPLLLFSLLYLSWTELSCLLCVQLKSTWPSMEFGNWQLLKLKLLTQALLLLFQLGCLTSCNLLKSAINLTRFLLLLNVLPNSPPNSHFHSQSQSHLSAPPCPCPPLIELVKISCSLVKVCSEAKCKHDTHNQWSWSSCTSYLGFPVATIPSPRQCHVQCTAHLPHSIPNRLRVQQIEARNNSHRQLTAGNCQLPVQWVSIQKLQQKLD